MTTDVRALLKAKTQERGKRITHPFAVYNSSGQLRCTVCTIVVKDNEIAWSGHLGSKSHRINVGRQKEMIKKEEEKRRLEKGKRKALVEEDGQGDGMEEDTPERIDRAEPALKRQRTEEPDRPNISSTLPSNFFSDPTRTLPTADGDEDHLPPTEPDAPAKPSKIDIEWAQFERDVLARKVPAGLGSIEGPPLSRKEIYDRATISGEEEIIYRQNDGFPAHLQHKSNEAGTGLAGRGVPANVEVLVEIPEDETPGQEKERKEREEKELIMDRILEEERAQEDADEKLRALKARLALVKKRREEERRRKAAGTS